MDKIQRTMLTPIGTMPKANTIDANTRLRSERAYTRKEEKADKYWV